MAEIRKRKNPRRGCKPDKPEKYKSGLEAKTAKYLEAHEVGFTYETVRIPFLVPEKKRNYIPDFILSNGIIVECKGRLDRDTREKMLLAITQNPDLDIRLLLMRDNKINKKHKTKYSDWCRKHGIKFTVSEDGVVPEEWIRE